MDDGAVGLGLDSDIQITATVQVGATTGPIAVTNPDGTATSTDDFTVIVAPSISGFTPKRGHVNTLVTITGTGFTGVFSVRFNGRAATFNVIDDTEIRARVPSVAGTGPIRVKNDAGSDLSNTNFGFRRIPHGVAITMRLDGHLRAIGDIAVRNANLSIRRMCGGGRRVLIQRFRDGRFRTVAHGRTQRDGDYRIGLRDREGRYRALVGGKLTPNHRCRPDASRAKTHAHPNPPPDGGVEVVVEVARRATRRASRSDRATMTAPVAAAMDPPTPSPRRVSGNRFRPVWLGRG